MISVSTLALPGDQSDFVRGELPRHQYFDDRAVLRGGSWDAPAPRSLWEGPRSHGCCSHPAPRRRAVRRGAADRYRNQHWCRHRGTIGEQYTQITGDSILLTRHCVDELNERSLELIGRRAHAFRARQPPHNSLDLPREWAAPWRVGAAQSPIQTRSDLVPFCSAGLSHTSDEADADHGHTAARHGKRGAVEPGAIA